MENELYDTQKFFIEPIRGGQFGEIFHFRAGHLKLKCGPQCRPHAWSSAPIIYTYMYAFEPIYETLLQLQMRYIQYMH